ncbi:MAG TPA: hypothetical protein PLR99_26020 [Polyangiaceae bacterium]|nr:hypothetical protein [Polyangiaceae bacterium]
MSHATSSPSSSAALDALQRVAPPRRTVGRAARGLALALVALAGLSGVGDSPSAVACSSSRELAAVSERHPDLPLAPFVAGRLGVLQPTYARSHLVVAYAWLSGKRLDASAQRSGLELDQRRLAPPAAQTVAPGVVPAPAPDVVGAWERERARVLGQAPAPRPPADGPSGVPTYTTPSTFVTIEGCLADAFRVARDTLLDREARLGARSPELVAWTQAQTLVFSNCSDPNKKAIPAPLPGAATQAARADRAYQIASAYFYSNQLDEAERRFRAIAADRASPWSALAGYVLARVRVRRATLGHDDADKAELGRALVEVDAQLRDPSRVALHASLRRYRELVRVRLEPARLVPELSAKLAAGGLGAETGAWLDDYTTVLDADEAALASGPVTDELTTFLGAVQGRRAFDVAHAKHTASPSSEAWLVAALMSATNANDPRVGPLVQEALAVAPSSPAYATARFHGVRLSAARGLGKAATLDLVRRTRDELGPSMAPSTRNALAGLAARSAPDLAAFLREAPLTPAGASEDNGPIVFDPALPAALPPELADMLSAGLPLTAFRDAALSTALPSGVRAALAAATWLRAHLLGDLATAGAVAPVVSRLNSALAPYVARVERATSADERRLGLVHLVLTFPSVGPGIEGWKVGPATRPAEGLSSSSAGDLWCGVAPPAPLPAPGFVSTPDHERGKRERAALDQLGAAATWLGFEAARVAEALPRDPRSPEVLHLAVRATRYGCKDARTPVASKRAFQVLHRRFPTSSWAKATPYYY